jgi:hypothetical protein
VPEPWIRLFDRWSTSKSSERTRLADEAIIASLEEDCVPDWREIWAVETGDVLTTEDLRNVSAFVADAAGIELPAGFSWNTAPTPIPEGTSPIVRE